MYVRVRVTPSAKKESVKQVSETEFTISVREPAERNLANTRVQELLALALSIPAKQVRMVSGHRSQVKMFTVEL